jgi:hypothetical protein
VSFSDPRIPLDDLIAAIHASLVTAPVPVLEKLNDQLVIAAVQADPEGARATWGLLPEHQVHTPAEQKFRDGDAGGR